MSEVTEAQRGAARAVHRAAGELNKAIYAAAQQKLTVEISVLLHLSSMEGVRVAVPIVESAVKEVENL